MNKNPTVRNVLVTGGAGYVGSHFVKLLLQQGHHPIIIDNLLNGNRDAVLCDDFYRGELENEELLRKVFSSHQIDAVVHFAAYMYVAESMDDPRKYHESNTVGALRLLGACLDHDVKRFVFSSSCSVYGAPEKQPILESDTHAPINPYGWTKFYIERVLEAYQDAYGMQTAALRYFNVAGADPENKIGERHQQEIHVIPLLIQAARDGSPFVLYGIDHPTRDGSCIRDYVHVWDLARAHLAAIERLGDSKRPMILNLGTGRGTTVLELISAVESASGSKIQVEIAGRRAGDPSVLTANPSLAHEVLGWNAEYATIEAVVNSAWQFAQTQ